MQVVQVLKTMAPMALKKLKSHRTYPFLAVPLYPFEAPCSLDSVWSEILAESYLTFPVGSYLTFLVGSYLAFLVASCRAVPLGSTRSLFQLLMENR